MKRSNPTIGTGFIHRPGFRRIVIDFDLETFDQVRERAVREGSSFAAQIRQLVEWGLMAEETAE